MISFKKFLTEKAEGQWHQGDGIDVHHHVIDGHQVHVMYHKGDFGKKSKKRHYEIHFTVNGSEKAHGHSPATSGKMLRFVHKSITHYIGKHKPRKISMLGDNGEKDSHWKKLASVIARRHKGEDTSTHHEGGGHVEWKHR